uniref:Uncharacterized protein n=1 Tax=Meloidogyne hapla TaxID=6305 RepID=A0A1I8BQ95_MELHA
MKTINNHHQPERTILSLDTLTKCEPSKDNPNQKRCTIEMHDTNYENAFEIYAKAPNDDNHLSLVTKINPNECKLGKNVFVEPGQVRAECKKDAGLIDLNKLETKIKLNSEEAERVKKYQTESIIRRSLLDPENEYHQRNKEDIESLQITNQNIRFFQHPSFYELHKKRRQLSEERLKSYDPNIQSSNLRRTKSQNDINPLEEKNRHLSEKHLHVYSHNVPTLNLQSSKSEDINSWKEIHRHLTEEPKTQTFNLKRSNLYEWRDFKHGDNFKGVESFETDETIN